MKCNFITKEKFLIYELMAGSLSYLPGRYVYKDKVMNPNKRMVCGRNKVCIDGIIFTKDVSIQLCESARQYSLNESESILKSSGTHYSSEDELSTLLMSLKDLIKSLKYIGVLTDDVWLIPILKWWIYRDDLGSYRMIFSNSLGGNDSFVIMTDDKRLVLPSIKWVGTDENYYSKLLGKLDKNQPSHSIITFKKYRF